MAKSTYFMFTNIIYAVNTHTCVVKCSLFIWILWPSETDFWVHSAVLRCIQFVTLWNDIAIHIYRAKSWNTFTYGMNSSAANWTIWIFSLPTSNSIGMYSPSGILLQVLYLSSELLIILTQLLFLFQKLFVLFHSWGVGMGIAVAVWSDGCWSRGGGCVRTWRFAWSLKKKTSVKMYK